MMLADNYWPQLIIMLGLICATLAYVPATWLIITRDMFAWSFDRLLPAKFSEVNERFHTPVWSIFANFIVAEILVLLFTYLPQYTSGFFSVGWDATLAETTVLCIALAVLPLRKTLWADSPLKNRKLAGIPIITIVGIIGAYYNGYVVYLFSTSPSVGFARTGAGWIILGAAVIAFILYPVIRVYRKSQGIDIDLIFRSAARIESQTNRASFFPFFCTVEAAATLFDDSLCKPRVSEPVRGQSAGRPRCPRPLDRLAEARYPVREML